MSEFVFRTSHDKIEPETTSPTTDTIMRIRSPHSRVTTIVPEDVQEIDFVRVGRPQSLGDFTTQNARLVTPIRVELHSPAQTIEYPRDAYVRIYELEGYKSLHLMSPHAHFGTTQSVG